MYLTSQQCFFITQFHIIDFRYYNYDARIFVIIKNQWVKTASYLALVREYFSLLFYFPIKLQMYLSWFINCCCIKFLLFGPGHCSMTWVPPGRLPWLFPMRQWTEQLRTFIFQGSTQQSYGIWALKPDKQFRQLAKAFKLLVGLFSQVFEVAWVVFTWWLLAVYTLLCKPASEVWSWGSPLSHGTATWCCWMVWLRNSFVSVDWCCTWWFSHIKKISTSCQHKGNARALFVGTSPSSWGLFPPTDSSKSCRTRDFTLLGGQGEDTAWEGDAGLSAKIARLPACCEDPWQSRAARLLLVVLEEAQALWKQPLVVCVCPWPLCPWGDVVQGSTAHIWQAWGLSWAWKGKSKSLYKYQDRATPTEPWSAVQPEKGSQSCKGPYKGFTRQRAHFFRGSKERWFIILSFFIIIYDFWTQSWEVPTCVKKQPCATTKDLSFHQVRDLMRSRGRELEQLHKLVIKPGLTEDGKMWKIINCWKSTTGEAD